MILKRIRVRNYTVIADTDWVPVGGHVTALVGENEAGKSGVLRSLWKSKNVVDRKETKTKATAHINAINQRFPTD